MRACVWAGPRFLSVRACARGSSQALCMGTGPRARMAAGLGAQPCCYCHLVFTSCAARAPGGDCPGGGRWGRFLKCRGHLRSVPQRTRRGCCGGFGSRCLMQAAHPHASEPEPKSARERACACARVRCASPCLSPSTCSFPSLLPSSCLYLLSQRTPHTDHRKPRTSGSFESNTVGLRRGGMSGPGGPSGRTRAVKQVLRSNQASKHLTLTFYSVHPKIPFEPPKESLPGKSKGNVTGNGEYLHLYLNL